MRNWERDRRAVENERKLACARRLSEIRDELGVFVKELAGPGGPIEFWELQGLDWQVPAVYSIQLREGERVRLVLEKETVRP